MQKRVQPMFSGHPLTGQSVTGQPVTGQSAQASRQRRGVAMIIVMVLLLVLSSVTITTVRAVIAQRKQFEIEKRHWQADWLLDAGLSRAAAQLASNADYSGETWKLSASEFSGSGSPLSGDAVVVIEPRAMTEAGSARRWIVQVSLPSDQEQPIRRQAELSGSSQTAANPAGTSGAREDGSATESK